MLITLISYLIMTIVFAVIGLDTALLISEVFDYRIKNCTSLIWIGLVFCTIYAEYVSILFKVGKAAFYVLCVICILPIAHLVKKKKIIVAGFRNRYAGIKDGSIIFFVYIVILILGSYLASRVPDGYDTQNYHIPSIRWMEEYGVVKGLGNLHSRFAYNSSFLCLQALFSFSWISNPMHSMNGYIWVLMMLYAFRGLSLYNERNFGLSDIFRGMFLLILFSQGVFIASPNTDFMPLCITAYIFIEWCVLNENNEQNDVPYVLLAIFGMFAVSVKLSAITLVLFTIYMCIKLMVTRKFKLNAAFFAMAFLVLLPFLIRNVIISGYLIYPVAYFDFFDVDWKMPKSVIISDNAAIKLFARWQGGGYVYSDINKNFEKWLPVWFDKASIVYKLLGAFNLIYAPCLLVKEVFGILRKRFGTYDHILMITLSMSFLFLMFSAPSVRFGMGYFYFIPSVALFKLFEKGKLNKKIDGFFSKNKISYRIVSVVSIMIMLAYLERAMFHYDGTFLPSKQVMIQPNGYLAGGDSGEYIRIGEYRFYYYKPTDGGNTNLNGYYGFPGTECRYTLEKIELRGTGLKDGFRVNADSRDKKYDFMGRELDSEASGSLGIDKYY